TPFLTPCLLRPLSTPPRPLTGTQQRKQSSPAPVRSTLPAPSHCAPLPTIAENRATQPSLLCFPCPGPSRVAVGWLGKGPALTCGGKWSTTAKSCRSGAGWGWAAPLPAASDCGEVGERMPPALTGGGKWSKAAPARSTLPAPSRGAPLPTADECGEVGERMPPLPPYSPAAGSGELQLGAGGVERAGTGLLRFRHCSAGECRGIPSPKPPSPSDTAGAR
ncbi:hypothetical protein KIL84_010638, partial [Mauremys mutica]